MNAALDLLSTPQRQSPLAVVFLALRAVRSFGISQVVIFVVFASQAPIPGGLFVLIPLIILALFGFGLLAWWRYTFVVANDELQVSKGVFTDDRLSLPLDRVQSVSIEQQFMHRLVGLVEVSIDSAGTSDTEFKIDAVPRGVAEALRVVSAEQVASAAASEQQDAQGPVPPVAPDRVLLRRSPSDLVKIALSQSPFTGLAFALPLLAFSEQISRWVPLPVGSVESLAERDFGLWVIGLVVAVLVAGVLIGGVVLLLRELVTNWNLTLAATPSGLRRSAGLISKTSRASSIPRIQRFESSQNLMQQWVGISAVRLPTVGGDDGSGDLVLPGCSSQEVAMLRAELLDDSMSLIHLHRELSPLLIFLRVRNTSIMVALLIAALMFSPVGVWSLVGLLAIPWAWYEARRQHQRTRWDFTDHSIRLHREVFAQHEVDMAFRKLQVATVSRSFFERRRGLATLRLLGTSGQMRIRLIDHDLASRVRDLALASAETDTRAWM